MLRSLANSKLLVLDDWEITPLADEQERDLFKVMEDRYDHGSTFIAAQLPVKHWHETIDDPTLADVVRDRPIHNAYTVTLKGEPCENRRPQT